MAKLYKIIKSSDSKLLGVVFEYVILNDMQPPKWFQEFEKRNNARFDRIENRLTVVEDILKCHSIILERHSDILGRNNLH